MTIKKFQFDADAVRQLAQILTETSLTEIEYENEGCRIYVAKQHQMAAHVPPMIAAPTMINTVSLEEVSSSPTPQTLKQHPGVVKSPMVGTVYLAPEPGADTFIRVGDHISEGQTLLIIEAMKVMNPIKAPKAGKVIHVFVKDASPVEYAEPLLVIE